MKTKFRAWDKDLKQMFRNVNPIFDADGNLDFIIYEYECTGYNMTEIGIEKWDAYMAHEKGIPVELMQYTGLKDSNGVEIFEGDVLGSPNNKRDNWYVSHHFVVWRDTGFLAKQICSSGSFIGIDYWTKGRDGYIVIGNIYQNKELLEGE
ncbi:YopX family protein [Brochothrix thermosphacta]|uniref:YopX family protein n=1 Tax=Brochothrix thermosphacta TaxID=2756 RepID=UPI0039AF7CE6